MEWEGETEIEELLISWKYIVSYRRDEMLEIETNRKDRWSSLRRRQPTSIDPLSGREWRNTPPSANAISAVGLAGRISALLLCRFEHIVHRRQSITNLTLYFARWHFTDSRPAHVVPSGSWYAIETIKMWIKRINSDTSVSKKLLNSSSVIINLENEHSKEIFKLWPWKLTVPSWQYSLSETAKNLDLPRYSR